MNRQTTTQPAAAIEADGRRLRALISAETRDRADDRLLAAGCELTAYRRNPVVLWAHDHRLPPIGRAITVRPEPGVGVWAENEFATTPFAQELLGLYRDGFLNAFSVGFRPLEVDRHGAPGSHRGGLTISRWELLEQSAVAVPANPDALVAAAGDGNRAADWLLKTYYAAGVDDAVLLRLLGLPADGGEPAWPDLAAACYRFHGAGGGVRLAPAERERLGELLRAAYERRGRRFPEPADGVAPSPRSTRFHHDEAGWFELAETARLGRELRCRALALRRLARQRQRRAAPLPAPPQLEAVRQALAALAEVTAATDRPASLDALPPAAWPDLRDALTAAVEALGQHRREVLLTALAAARRDAIGGQPRLLKK